MTDPIVHCQVCARNIKAKNGRIAHHGYKRPHQQGWQTASCYGAKHVPYEVGHDALDAAIVSCAAHLASLETAQANWLANPPATLVHHEEYAGRRTGKTTTYAKPEGFDTAKSAARGSYSRHTYEGEWGGTFWDRKGHIKGTSDTLVFLRNRRAAWVAPASTPGE